MKRSPSASESEPARPSGWCLGTGLALLPAWLLGGLALEGLHALKSPAYLQDELRREMWTLAHAHGTLFALSALVVAMLAPRLVDQGTARRVDRLFAPGAVLLPLGFFGGGLVHSEADPGAAILLVPAGALLAAAGLILLAVRTWRPSRA